MTTKTPAEHYLEAERHLQLAADARVAGQLSLETYELGVAQVHATLATVPQSTADAADRAAQETGRTR